MDDLPDDSPSLTEQLRHFSGGDRSIAEAVLRKVLPELHRVAVRELKREHKAAPLSPTELIHEVWLRNLSKGGWQINSQQHFYAIDLKPENLMIRSDGAPGEDLVLIDFSIAIVQDPDETLHGLSRAAGTLRYMVPEQAIGYADASSDI